mmetsp:Transcript_28841/g.27629  ORF Transcript_28841/g.27629 Transcript_28841/m.27629 type:complete len:165 (+) Transcript_28841:61-555(+)|eukprot:CAMPEP_0119041456 /NCGR_PEP_ID=MMETSP1177-20130426/12140_1 /TAXON_ID=2985 /ORGANISM="Ochromonas sp, Strain CCMP1899" /LENGTH=164 /DNA_ID=CAMNT_0007007501 /DNA_START=61 /DNA_END=555 /DNA_ORIENTATION=+
MSSITATCTVGPNGKPCDASAAEASNVTGVINFVQVGSEPTTVSYSVTGLTPGQHAFHIHELADFSNGCVSAGPHYNPFKKEHGGPDDEERHVGDLGNIVADESGASKGELSASLIQLSGEYSIIGRSVMVHAGVDDCGKGGHELSKTTGNAGGRLACGEIFSV